MEIIPAIDIIEGKCVRLRHGDFSQKKIYNEDPLEVAIGFEVHGITRLHLVDLDGARWGAVKNWKVLEAIAGKTNMVIDFGGGINQLRDLEIIFNSGASMAAIGSMAVKDENLFTSWISQYSADKFLLGADVRDEKISIHGWTEQTAINVYDFIEKWNGKGLKKIFCTDISKDGALEGPSVDLYKRIIERFPQLHFIASGGVSSLDDLVLLEQIGTRGVIIGKAIYEGKISLDDLEKMVVAYGK